MMNKTIVLYPGFEKFMIHPHVFNEMTSAEEELISVKGIIKSNWRKDHRYFYLDITIPANSAATVFIPTMNTGSITERNLNIKWVKEVEYLRTNGDYAAYIYSVSLETYHFKSIILN